MLTTRLTLTLDRAYYNVKPAQAAPIARTSASAAASAPGTARRRPEDTRARCPAPAPASVPDLKADRCRCTGACPSAAFTNIFRKEYAVVNLEQSGRV